MKCANDIDDLIEQLSAPDNCNVLDYIDDAVEAIKELKARAETSEAIVDKYQTEIVPKWRRIVVNVENERDWALAKLNNMKIRERRNNNGLQELLEDRDFYDPDEVCSLEHAISAVARMVPHALAGGTETVEDDIGRKQE